MILEGHVLEQLAKLPDESVNCIITSPPYWGLRDYGLPPVDWGGNVECAHVWQPQSHIANKSGGYSEKQVSNKGAWNPDGIISENAFCSLCGAWRGQLGLEPRFQDYIEHLMMVMAECKRILKSDGTMFIVLADTYASSNMNPNQFPSVSHVRSCDSGGKEQSDLKENDRVYHYYDGELQGDCQNHQNCIFHNEKQHQQCVLHFALKDRDNGHWDSVSSFLDAFSLVVQESTIPSGTWIAQDASPREDKVLASLFAIHSFLHDEPLSADRAVNTYGIFEKLLPSDCHIRGRVLSFLAYIPPYGLTSYNITMPSLNVKIKPKSLCQIPSRFAIAMTDAGWILRNEIIWYKRNAMPSSVKDRFTVDFEPVYFYTKSGKYWFEQQKEANHTTPGPLRNKNAEKYSGMPGQFSDGERTFYSEDGRNMRTVWDIPTKPCAEAHFAVFPDTLVERCLLAGCPVDGVVLDPFLGSGTVGKVALKHNRNFIGIEMNPSYIEIAYRRVYGTSV